MTVRFRVNRVTKVRVQIKDRRGRVIGHSALRAARSVISGHPRAHPARDARTAARRGGLEPERLRALRARRPSHGAAGRPRHKC